MKQILEIIIEDGSSNGNIDDTVEKNNLDSSSLKNNLAFQEELQIQIHQRAKTCTIYTKKRKTFEKVIKHEITTQENEEVQRK